MTLGDTDLPRPTSVPKDADSGRDSDSILQGVLESIVRSAQLRERSRSLRDPKRVKRKGADKEKEREKS